MFSNFLRSSLRSAKNFAKPLTMNFLGVLVHFFLLQLPFLLPLLSYTFLFQFQKFSLVNSSANTSGSCSLSSSPTPGLKLAQPQAFWFLQHPHPWQFVWSHGRISWVSSSKHHSFTPWWHTPRPKQVFWWGHRCCNPSRIASVSSQYLPQL